MYQVSIVTTVKELQEAWGLLYQQYLKYRLIEENHFKLWAFPHYFTKPAGTWVGKENQIITSTISCVLDKEHLLPLDNYYHKNWPDEKDAVRTRCINLKLLIKIRKKK